MSLVVSLASRVAHSFADATYSYCNLRFRLARVAPVVLFCLVSYDFILFCFIPPLGRLVPATPPRKRRGRIPTDQVFPAGGP